MKWYKDKYTYISFGLCFFLAFLSFLPFIVQGDGLFSLSFDYDNQQIPFSIGMINAIKAGDTGWQWNVSLGSSFMEAYSFYELGSFFSWLALPFGAKFFPYIAAWIYMFKYALTGAFAYLYLRRWTKKRFSALTGALLYAFSGFQCENIVYYHFHDVVAFFPLLLTGLDKLVKEGKKGYFAVAVAVNAMVNYVFFAGEVVFCIIYYFFLKSEGAIKGEGTVRRIIKYIRESGDVILEGLIGISAAAWILIPSALALMSNPRTDVYLDISDKNSFFYSAERYIRLLKGLFFISESPGDPSIGCERAWNWSSISAYLPMTGLSLVLAYCRKKKDMIRNIILICAVMSCTPLLTRIFFLGTAVAMRWWYMPVLMMALASARVMEEPGEYDIRRSSIFLSGAMILFVVCLLLFRGTGDVPGGITDPGKLAMLASASLAGVILTALSAGKEKTKYYFAAGICLYAACSTVFCIYDLKKMSDTDVEKEMAFASMLPETDINYRYRSVDNYLQFAGGASASGCYSSTVNGAVFRFNRAFGYERTNVDGDWGYDGIPGLYEYIGAAYAIYDEVPAGYESAVVSEMEYKGEKRYVLKGSACPVARSYSRYMYRSEFDELERNLKGIAVINCLIVPDECKDQTAGLEHIVPAAFKNLSEEEKGLLLAYGVTEAEERKLPVSERSDKGFKLTGPFEDDTFAFAAVPAAEGWSVYADGKPVQIVDVCGLMAVRVNEDIREISFEYETPGMTAGKALSLIGVLVFVLTSVAIPMNRLRRSKRGG